jgi:predicted nucleotidyltransferase
MMITSEQQGLIESITRALQARDDVEAAWLAGSLGAGRGDAFSDVDVLLLTGEGAATAVSARIAGDIGAIAEPALINALYGGRVLNVVTVDWLRFDLSFAEPRDLIRYDAGRLKALFNTGDREPPRRESEAYKPSPVATLALVKEFFRILGLLVVGLGREEYLLGLTGVDLLRRLTVDLMLEANGVGPTERGGALHRNPLLNDDQRRRLNALRPVVADRQGLIAANAEVAAIFLPLARDLAARTGAAWPTVLDEATRRYLTDRLGLAI